MTDAQAALVAELQAEGTSWYNFRLKESAVGRKLLALGEEEQRDFVLAVAGWLDQMNISHPHDQSTWIVRAAMLALLRHRLPFDHDGVASMLTWSARVSNRYWRGAPQMIKMLEDHLREHELTPALRERIGQLVTSLEAEHSTADTRKAIARLRELGGSANTQLPLVAGEAWSDAAISDVEGMDEVQRLAWTELLNVCTKAGGSQPSAKWLKSAEPTLEKLGYDQFKRAVLRWFPLVDKPRTQRVESWPQYRLDPNNMPEGVNADVLRSLVWLCAREEDREVARALTALAVSAYRKVPGVGPRCVRVGNACVWSLGEMPGTAGVEQLALLKIKVKFGTAQRGIEAALARAAKRAGLPQDEIEEMSVPVYGMQEVGTRREQLGDFAAELVVTGTNSAELRWTGPNGKRQSSVPQAVKERHAEELKELSGAVKDIRKMLPAQRDRIENLYLEQKSWPLPLWRERYLDHPLVGTIARRLIWKFTDGGNVSTGIWHGGRIVGSDGSALSPEETTLVELWHPIDEPAEKVLAWRDFLAEREVRQPFKQAHREIYVLTDAERATRVYSNRFAAHVIRQHQFNALCAARGWKNKLRLMVDDSCPPATRPVPKWNLRAEFWVESVGENYGTDTTDSGTYLYLTTDQVRFYPIDAPQHLAHVAGGGYYLDPHRLGVVEPLALEQVPPLVFSEIMRDVDMFVGVASVANDPNWADGGPEGRYQNYWASYSFGDLSETAKTRRGVLERLVPRLKIAGRCHLADRVLVVRGDVRTYKIHLGSGNILMEPNDQYLCIVPARGAAAEAFTGKVFLPFEGDNTLAIILSKAFLLAEDTKITDPTIVRQIGG
jgi:hypothetical protein